MGSKITTDGDYSHEIKTLAPWKKGYLQTRQHIIKQRYYFANNGPLSQSYGYSSSHVWMCGEGNGNPFQYSCLENPMAGEAWWASVHGTAKSQTRLKQLSSRGCERWTVKKAERRRIDAFELGCWRRLLRVPWIARRPNQSILKEISPKYSLEGLTLKLKLQ